MARIFGTVESSGIADSGNVETVYSIPAVTKTTARGRARANNRLKGLDSSSIVSVEKESTGQLPGQSIYRVVVESER